MFLNITTLSAVSSDPKSLIPTTHLHAVLVFGIQHLEQNLCLPGLPIHGLMATAPVNLREGSMTQVLMLEGERKTGEVSKGAPVDSGPRLLA